MHLPPKKKKKRKEGKKEGRERQTDRQTDTSSPGFSLAPDLHSQLPTATLNPTHPKSSHGPFLLVSH